MCNLLPNEKETVVAALLKCLQKEKPFTGYTVGTQMETLISKHEVSAFVRELFNGRYPDFAGWASFPATNPETLVYTKLSYEQLEEIRATLSSAT
jgi:hypothetical protein